MNGGTLDRVPLMVSWLRGSTTSSFPLILIPASTGRFTCCTFSTNETTALFIQVADFMEPCPINFPTARATSSTVYRDPATTLTPCLCDNRRDPRYHHHHGVRRQPPSQTLPVTLKGIKWLRRQSSMSHFNNLRMKYFIYVIYLC